MPCDNFVRLDVGERAFERLTQWHYRFERLLEHGYVAEQPEQKHKQ